MNNLQCGDMSDPIYVEIFGAIKTSKNLKYSDAQTNAPILAFFVIIFFLIIQYIIIDINNNFNFTWRQMKEMILQISDGNNDELEVTNICSQVMDSEQHEHMHTI